MKKAPIEYFLKIIRIITIIIGLRFFEWEMLIVLFVFLAMFLYLSGAFSDDHGSTDIVPSTIFKGSSFIFGIISLIVISLSINLQDSSTLFVDVTFFCGTIISSVDFLKRALSEDLEAKKQSILITAILIAENLLIMLMVLFAFTRVMLRLSNIG